MINNARKNCNSQKTKQIALFRKIQLINRVYWKDQLRVMKSCDNQNRREKTVTKCRLRGSALDTFYEINFWLADPKTFLKAPIHNYFEGERAPKNRGFSVNTFQIPFFVPKNGLFDQFFFNACGSKNLSKYSLILTLLKIRPPPQENP